MIYPAGLEHATDATVTDALAEYLGNPTICPHGHPIPDADGTVVIPTAFPLNEIGCEVEVEILRIDQPELILCEYLEERGMLPGTICKDPWMRHLIMVHLPWKLAVKRSPWVVRSLGGS